MFKLRSGPEMPFGVLLMPSALQSRVWSLAYRCGGEPYLLTLVFGSVPEATWCHPAWMVARDGRLRPFTVGFWPCR